MTDSRWPTALHEAGHVVAAEAYGLRVIAASAGRGKTWVHPDEDVRPLDGASLFVAGTIAEQIESGRAVEFDFGARSTDASSARFFLEDAPDPRGAEALAVLRARSLLTSRWSIG